MDFVFKHKKVSGILTVLPRKAVKFEDEMANYNFPPAKSMKLYPNPVVNTTQVKIAGSDRETHELTLYNSYGTPVLKPTFSGSEYRLDMNSLPQGVYMLSVDDMNTKTVKL